MNKRNYYKIVLLILGCGAIVLLNACTDNSNDAATKPAQELTVSQIKATPGYAWFEPEFNIYHPVGSILDSIKNEFLKSNCLFYVFVNPTCSCVGTQKNFPHLVKILDTAGITSSSYKIFSMLSYKSPHPYQSILTLTQLPSLYVIKNGKAVYSVLDSLQYYQALNSTLQYTIEEFILKGLKAN